MAIKPPGRGEFRSQSLQAELVHFIPASFRCTSNALPRLRLQLFDYRQMSLNPVRPELVDPPYKMLVSEFGSRAFMQSLARWIGPSL